MMADDLDNLFDSARQFLSRRYPGSLLAEIRLRLHDGRKVVLAASPRCHVSEAQTPARLPRRSHSNDFRSVHWFGVQYSFTASQAAVVKLLWEADENDTPEMSQQAILEEIGSDCQRLSDLFKRHAAWGVMIVQGETAGSYRLANEPETDIKTA